jgi:SgrR family transcriptional regulator
MLNPIKSPRRSEQNIIQQIFSGLTKFDEDDQLCPDLAHSWEHIDDNVWRFYLRPSVRFHDGNRLDISDILDSIVSLKKTALFAHISAVHSPSPWVIDVELNLVDFHFPALLALPVAKILPSKLKNDEDFDTKPIGTGPFRVVQNSDKHLVLQAFDDYFGLRPLIDQVEVWVIDEVHSNIVYPCLDTPKLPTKSSTNSVELDPGCTYLLINRTSGLARNSQWNRYFGSVLSSFNLFSLIPQSKVVELGLLHAHGLRPGWVHHTGRDQCEVPENETVKIAFYKEHIAFNLIAKGLEKLLRRDGLDVQLISYTEQEPNIQDVDIWIRPMGISTKRDDSLVSWFLLDSAIEQACDPLLYKEATKLIHEWRSKANLRFNGAELGKLLVENQQMIPLFHCWLGVDKDQSGALQNVKCNALGWFDFSAAWIKPVLVE